MCNVPKLLELYFKYYDLKTSFPLINESYLFYSFDCFCYYERTKQVGNIAKEQNESPQYER